ncbi:hypothetical protein [Marinibacterium profundimaris]|uniref:hypothetical protein n=1 Tax=Marinibacterium profundimaris TaxID=1679460 RepID=UPI000B522FDA|nr:hypothetical protein [Marinibacterium profundimaris]
MRRIAALCRPDLVLVTLLVLVALALPASAGPWLRDPRVSFLSFQATPRSDGQVEYGFFGERGMTPWLTLGLDLNDNGTSGHALAFARLPVSRNDWVASFDLALGGHRYKDDTGSMARVLFGIGRNIEVWDMPGWAALNVGPEWRQGNGGAAWKADGVIGFSADRAVNPILSVETYLSPGKDLYWSVIPGALVRGKTEGRTWLFGLEQKGGPSEMTTGLRIGYWIDF